MMCSDENASSTGASTRNRSSFTAAQWQELEHQALIFKYMISGMPIPPELIYSVKRSLDSSTSSRFFPTHHPVGWGCFDMSFGRKVDPEPGRCRRTDGKKWRCSKEAYPDSKYCEKHMHRGRNRSRKPVEVAAPTPTAAAINTTINNTITSPSISSMNRNISLSNNPDTSASPFSFSPLSSYPYPCQNSFLTAPSTYSRTPASEFSPQIINTNTTPRLLLESSSYSQAGKEYSHDGGDKAGTDEQALFPEASRTSSSYANSYNQPLIMSSYDKGYSPQSHYHSATTVSGNNQRPQEQQHCFVLGTDFKSQRTDKTGEEPVAADTQKPLHHFFSEWPPKDSDSWLDLASSSSKIPHDD